LTRADCGSLSERTSPFAGCELPNEIDALYVSLLTGRQLALNPNSSEEPAPDVPAYETFGPSVSLSFTLYWSANCTWREAVANVEGCTKPRPPCSGVNVVIPANVEPDSVKVCLSRVSVALAARPRASVPLVEESGLSVGTSDANGQFAGWPTICPGHASV